MPAPIHPTVLSLGQVVPALKALSKLIKNHASALLDPVPTSAGSAGAGEEGRSGGSARVIAEGIFEELHLPALSQSIRQVRREFF